MTPPSLTLPPVEHTVKERPILFSGEMVRAILDGRKSQTRRVVTTSPSAPWHTWEKVFLAHRWTVAPHPRGGFWAIDVPDASESMMAKPPGKDAGFPCPYGQPEDRLWVRETWAGYDAEPKADAIIYRAEPMFDSCKPSDFAWPWRSPIHMPRAFSRLTLEITAVRVERLQEIREPDCLAEGIPTWRGMDEPNETDPFTLRERYASLWNRLNEKRGYSWESNPWVWVIEFLTLPRVTS